MDYQLVDNKVRKRYEYDLGDGVAVIEYIRTENKIFLTHTEVSRQHEGKGIASRLVKEVLGEVEKSGLKLMPLCPYVAAYIKRHPEWRRILDERVNIG